MKFRIIAILIFTMVTTACEDVIEEDIRDHPVVLLAPPADFETTRSLVTFWWEEVEGAFEYNIQVVRPGFDYVADLLLDSTLSSNRFDMAFGPGSYQWRVIARNGNYNTISQILSFTVDSATNVNDVVIQLISPEEGAVLSDGLITFEWDQHELVEDYRFEIRTPDWNGGLVFPALLLQNTGFTNSDNQLPDGTYEWGVQGQSGPSNSPFNIRKLTIDKTAPGMPVLSVPGNGNSQSGGSVAFKWFRPTDTGTQVKDSFFIYSDAALTIPARPVQITDQPAYSDSLSTGSYYWFVKSFDEAGNSSSPSQVWNFTVNP